MTMLLVAILLAMQAPGNAIHAASPRFTVDVLDRGSEDSGARLMITRKDSTRYHIVTLNRALGRVLAVQLRDDDGRAIAITERGFAVIDPEGRGARDEVYGYGATPSADARWIAYARFFPEPESPISQGIVMYDTMKGPDENRSAFPIPAERSSASGWPVYPPASQWKRSSAVAADRNAYATVGIAPSWDGRFYLTAMRVGAADVVIQADVSGPAIRVCTQQLPDKPDRWRQTPIRLTHQARPDGSSVVQIEPGTPGGVREDVVFAADCHS